MRKKGKFGLLSFADHRIRQIRDFLLFREYREDDGYESDIPTDETDFYDKFSKYLSGAKDKIFNCGDGFNMLALRAEGGERTSAEKADMLDEAIIKVMEEHPLFIYKRFQIISACNLNWISRLIYMKSIYKDRFIVFTNRNFDHIGCFSATDPKSDNCVFQWQLVSGRRNTGTLSKGFGFTFRNKDICGVIGTMFDEIAASESTNNLKNDVQKKEMTTSRLRSLQRELWDERINEIQRNPDFKSGDPEIEAAFQNRGVDKTDFKNGDMDFREEEFPILPIHTNHFYRDLVKVSSDE